MEAVCRRMVFKCLGNISIPSDDGRVWFSLSFVVDGVIPILWLWSCRFRYASCDVNGRCSAALSLGEFCNVLVVVCAWMNGHRGRKCILLYIYGCFETVRFVDGSLKQLRYLGRLGLKLDCSRDVRYIFLYSGTIFPSRSRSFYSGISMGFYCWSVDLTGLCYDS